MGWKTTCLHDTAITWKQNCQNASALSYVESWILCIILYIFHFSRELLYFLAGSKDVLFLSGEVVTLGTIYFQNVLKWELMQWTLIVTWSLQYLWTLISTSGTNHKIITQKPKMFDNSVIEWIVSSNVISYHLLKYLHWAPWHLVYLWPTQYWCASNYFGRSITYTANHEISIKL